MKHLIQSLISPLAEGYAELYKKQKNFATLKKCGKEEFFGLRDFYRCNIVSVTLSLVCCLISLTVSFVSCSVLYLFLSCLPIKPYQDGVLYRCEIWRKTSLASTGTCYQEELWWPS